MTFLLITSVLDESYCKLQSCFECLKLILDNSLDELGGILDHIK